MLWHLNRAMLHYPGFIGRYRRHYQCTINNSASNCFINEDGVLIPNASVSWRFMVNVLPRDGMLKILKLKITNVNRISRYPVSCFVIGDVNENEIIYWSDGIFGVKYFRNHTTTCNTGEAHCKCHILLSYPRYIFFHWK